MKTLSVGLTTLAFVSTLQTFAAAPNFDFAGYHRPINPFDQWQPTWYACTRYAWGRAYELTGVRLGFAVTSGRNGGTWYRYVKNLERGSEPRANSIADWVGPGGIGHVAFVESVDDDIVTISEANWSSPVDGRYKGTKTFTKERMQNRSGYTLNGYIYLDSAGLSEATLKAVSNLGQPISNAQCMWDGVELDRTDANGLIRLPQWVCGTKILKIVGPSKIFDRLFTIRCPPALLGAAKGVVSPIVVELESNEGCPPRQIFDLAVGDTVEVFGTGIGLRGRTPDPCSSTYVTFPDGARGVIKGGPQCCNGYQRWLIRYDGEAVDRWSAEGEPETGELFLRKFGATKGSLRVTLAPQSAVDAGAQWRMNGGVYRNSGATVSGLSAGAHNISFKPVAGFAKPSDQTVTLTSGATTTASGDYVSTTPDTYTLSIDSQHGGVLRNPNRNQFSAGEIVRLTASADPGWHFDHWSGDASGTANPVDVVMNSDKSVTANYAVGDHSVGAINVTIQPAGAVAAGARWRDNGGAWTSSDVTLNNAYIGNHYLEFSAVPGWTKPPPRSVAVVGGQTTNVIATYTQDTTPGTLIVTLTPPDAVTVGAKWRVNGGAPQNSGASVSLPPGSGYTVTFDSVAGWTAPSEQAVTIQPGGTTLATGNYTAPAGQPIIGSIRPSIGRVTGGTLITIDGANFEPSASVTIGGKAASNVTVTSATRLSCLTPPSSIYTSAPVIVRTSGGAATNLIGFTYGTERGTNLNLLTQLGGAVRTAAVQGNYAFVGQGSRLVVLDISNLSSPAPVGDGLMFAATVNNIKIAGNYAYIANAEEGLQVVNISNPSHPTLVGTFKTLAAAQAVAILGGRAYVAATSSGIQIIDISAPSNLREAGAVSSDGWAFDIVVNASAEGVFAYVANLYGTFKIVNVTDPAAAAVVGSLNIEGDCYAVAYAANRAYVGGFTKFYIVDVSNSAAPTVLGTHGGGTRGIAYSSGYVFSLGGIGLRIVDVANPNSLTTVGILTGFSTIPFGEITVRSGMAFVSVGQDGFRAIDVSNRVSPVARGQYVDFVGYAGGIAFANNNLFVANDKKLEILDVQDPTAPIRRSPFTPAGQAQSVRAFGPRAYITQSGVVQIVDVSNPQSVSLLGTIAQTPLYNNDVFAVGSLGYFAGGSFPGYRPTLRILDLSTPSSPTQRSSLELSVASDLASGLTVGGNFAYVALHNSGSLLIVDVSNAGSPQMRGLLTGLGQLWAVSLSADGTHAFVASSEAVRIVDVRDPDNPRLVSNYNEGAYGCEVVGEFAYVAAGPRGVLVLDIKDRSNPRLARSYDTSGDARSVAVNESTVYVADGYDGVLLLAMPDADSPEAFITNPVFPALAPVYTNTIGSLNLGGGASDNIAVTRVTWSNTRGGGGDADGTDSWFVSGITLQPGTNILTVVAFDQAGNSGNDALTVIYQTPKRDQTITFPALVDRTFGDPPFALAAAASSGLPASFSIVSGPATLSDGVLTITGAGFITVLASQSGDDFFNLAPDVPRSFTVAKADQAIAFAELNNKSANDAPFALNATASSGLPVLFSIVSGPAVLDSNIVTVVGTGTVTVRAEQSGDANFNAAASVERTFAVASAPQFITFGALSGQILGDASFPLLAKASSGLPVSFAILSGPASLNGNLVTVTNVGVVTVRASQAGDSYFAPAPNVDQSFAVAHGHNVIANLLMAGGMFAFRFYGEPTRTCIIERSEDLQAWTAVRTNAVNASGFVDFSIGDDGLLRSFFRARLSE